MAAAAHVDVNGRGPAPADAGEASLRGLLDGGDARPEVSSPPKQVLTQAGAADRSVVGRTAVATHDDQWPTDDAAESLQSCHELGHDGSCAAVLAGELPAVEVLGQLHGLVLGLIR